MSFRTFKKDLKRKQEEERTLSALKNAEAALSRRKDEYAQKAKEALKAGDKQQYAFYVALLKNAMFNLAQAKDMTANFLIARDLREMQSLNQKFVHAINSVMKDVYKTSKSINVHASQAIFLKALAKQQYVSAELKSLLEENSIAFSSSVTAVSDISDDEVKGILEAEIKRDGADFDDTLQKLEREFSVGEVGTSAPASKVTARPLIEAEGTAPFAPSSAPSPVFSPAPASHAPSAPSAPAPAPAPAPTSAPSAPSGGEGKREFDVDNIAFRPTRLKDYVGQPNAVATVSDPIKKARLTGKPLPHILICGSYGQGKTTLAKIIANEMDGRFITISAGIKYREMLKTLRETKPNDIIFIDEVHKLATEVVETLLYPAMEDYEIHYTDTKGGKVVPKSEKIAPFTLIGATTESGKLLKPFYSKFPINVTLVDYDLATITGIVKNSFRVSHIEISDELAGLVAGRSRLSPRQANAYVNGIGALAIVREAERRHLPDGSLRDEKTVQALGITIQKQDILDYFGRLGIDELGLKEEERKILRVIIEMYGGGPVGQENIAKALNMATNRIDQEYEPLLVKLGFINVRPQGRFATDAAYRYLGYPPESRGGRDGTPGGPDGAQGDGEAPAPAYGSETCTAPDAPQDPAPQETIPQAAASGAETPDEEELPVMECTVGPFDAELAPKIEALFEGEGTPTERALGELFSPVEKEYDSAAKNRCYLRVSNGRELYCDSALERRFLKLLFERGFITDALSESLELDYSSRRMSGKKYYPDFILKLHDGRIAVVEMKNLSSMGYHLNIDKYECLAAYCAENGYLYAEIAKDDVTKKYVSAAQIKALPQDGQLSAFIHKKIDENGICGGDDLNAFGYDVRSLMCLLLNDRSLKNIDRTGGNPQIVSADE